MSHPFCLTLNSHERFGLNPLVAIEVCMPDPSFSQIETPGTLAMI